MYSPNKDNGATISSSLSPGKRRLLVKDTGILGILQLIMVMIYCHLSVTLLCINVMFDLFIFGMPLYILGKMRVISSKTHYRLTTILINWTTPIVYGLSLIGSGTRVYTDNVDILVEAKANNSLLLANHGSRIDWMIGMFIGHLKQIGGQVGQRCRVGFVCEAVIQLMPIVGWYRKCVCHDIFVWRSFAKDAPAIQQNIQLFHNSGEKRMLFLSPEGVVVDHNHHDRIYIHECRQFCKSLGYKPFEYVLTPRYKGCTCLLDQISDVRNVVSGCLVYVKNGKLLNCQLLSSSREVVDIYDLNQGNIDVYIHLRKFSLGKTAVEAKSSLMAEYAWKDSILSQWDMMLKGNSVAEEEWSSKYIQIKGNVNEVIFNHLAHALIILTFVWSFGCIGHSIKVISWIFLVIGVSHSIGCLVNTTSMESVPFETGVKAALRIMFKLSENEK